MNLGSRSTILFLLAAYIAAGMSMSCAARVSYRTYDRGYNDYHVWDDYERGYYNQWVVETHRPNRDFRKLSPDDQKAYWNWRHTNHPDNKKR